MSKTFAEAEAECLAQMEADRLAEERSRLARLPKAPVLEFPPKLSGADRERQERVAEQDRLRLEEYQRQERLNLWWWEETQAQKPERGRMGGEYHVGPNDPDWPA
jgi:hypothetical protein